MHDSWKPILKSEFDQPYFKELSEFLTDAYEHKTIYPPKQQVFSAFTTDLNDIKVVIIGQDPYHGPRQANGLAFSIHSGVQIPPSLQNIFKEINADVGAPIPNNGDLTRKPLTVKPRSAPCDFSRFKSEKHRSDRRRSSGISDTHFAAHDDICTGSFQLFHNIHPDAYCAFGFFSCAGFCLGA